MNTLPTSPTSLTLPHNSPTQQPSNIPQIISSPDVVPNPRPSLRLLIHPMITHGKAIIFNPEVLLCKTLKDRSLIEPTRVVDVLNTRQWKTAMNDEYSALVKNNTWSLVPGNKWIFCIKHNPNGTIQRYKARLVAKGFHQSPRVDFFETFSLVVKVGC